LIYLNVLNTTISYKENDQFSNVKKIYLTVFVIINYYLV